jgi:adenylosuccinate lyase
MDIPDWGTISLTALASAAPNAVIFGFWKPWLGAYGGEKGKNLARKEDLATILAEVRAVTNTQKEIEATLNSGEWNRQTLWVHKRDAYADVLKAGGKVARHYGKVATILRMLEGPTTIERNTHSNLTCYSTSPLL